jgi:hypothetical protein
MVVIGHLYRQGGLDAGRVQTQVRRCLIAAGGKPVRFSELMAWSYLRRRPWRVPVYAALKRYAVNVGYGRWRPNPELMARIKGIR